MITTHHLDDCDPLERKLTDFFAANPDEALTVSDCRIKFGPAAIAAGDVMRDMCARGVLKREFVVGDLQPLYSKA